MKKVIFYVLCLQLVLVAGCNNAGETKTAAADSTKAMEKTDSISKKIVTCVGQWPKVSNPNLTTTYLAQNYPLFEGKTEKVKFNYADFIQFADQGNGEIYMVFGAYDEEGTKKYCASHSTDSNSVYYNEIINKPCLIEAYESSGVLVYSDFLAGSLCPPPNSCSSDFAKKMKINNEVNPALRASIIKNYNIIYDNNLSLHLTEKVKFCISDIKSAVAALDHERTNTTTDIYFEFGAYTYSDAGQYLATHNLPRSEKPNIAVKPCLLFAYYDNNANTKDKFIHLDFGVIYPPGK